MKTQGSSLIENLGNLLLDADKLREVVSSRQITIHKAYDRLMKQLGLLEEVIYMKTNVAITHRILKSSQEQLFHWKKSLEFIVEISVWSTNELKDVHDLVQKVMENIFAYLKVLHIESYVSNNGWLVDIEKMKDKFLAFVDEAIDIFNFQVEKIQELSLVDSILRWESKKFQSKVTRVDKLVEMHDY